LSIRGEGADGGDPGGELLARMQRLDISKFHPDPVAECERIESERNAVFAEGGISIGPL
jgi:hypothetical protein